MTQFYNLCSSSSGNSTYLGSLTDGILFDAGIGIRNYEKSLHAAGIPPSAVRGIFVSHEHSDHIKGLASIAKRHHLPIYGSPGTVQALLADHRMDELTIHSLQGSVTVAGYRVTPFPTSHDSRESIGFRVETPDNLSVGICTDLGFVSDDILAVLSGCNFVMLESNYDESMLLYGSYPFFLKRRIASKEGHLSNQQCAEAIERLIQTNTRRFVLAHLSEQNNHPEVALAHTKNYLAQKNLLPERDYFIEVLAKTNDGRTIDLSC